MRSLILGVRFLTVAAAAALQLRTTPAQASTLSDSNTARS